MKPDRRLAFDEAGRILRSPWLAGVVVVLTAAVWAATRLGALDSANEQAAYEELVQGRTQAGVRSPAPSGRAAEPALRVIRPPTVGLVLVEGVDRSVPAAWEMTPAGPEALAPYVVGSGLRSSARWDLDSVVRFLASALALLLGIGTVLADKSSGWTAVLRSLPVSAKRVVAARLIGSCVAVTFAFCTWWALVTGVLWLAHQGNLAGELWACAPATLLFTYVWYALGIVCARAVRSELGGPALAMVLWLFASVLGPSMVVTTVELVVPVAPRANMERVRQDRYADAMRAAEQTVARELTRRIGPGRGPAAAEKMSDQAFPALEPTWQRLAAEARTAALSVEDEWWKHKKQQGDLAGWIACLSPGALIGRALSTTAGTGFQDALAWEGAVRQHARVLDSVLFDDRPLINLRIPVDSGSTVIALPRHFALSLSDLPRFDPPEPPKRAQVGGDSVALGALILWAVGSIAFAGVLNVRALVGQHRD